MKKELEYAIEAAHLAGQKILSFYKSKYDITDKSYHNPVTDADFASNQVIMDILQPAFPDYGWLSEETVDSPERLNAQRVWIVDPLDGTKEFIEGVDNFVVSIALVEDGVSVLGILYNPVTKELFHAIRGSGAFFNGDPITCSRTETLADASIVISRSETRKGLWEGTETWFREQAHIGSVAYKLGLTAAGRFDCFATLRPKNEWDVAAGQVILDEAGAELVNLESQQVRVYNQKTTLITPGLIGGNPHLIRQFQTQWANQTAEPV